MHQTNSFRFLWISQLFANIGGVFYIVGLIPLIHAVTGSATAMALVPFLTMVSRFVSAMIAPLLLERMHLQPLLALSQFAKTFVLLFLACFSTFFLNASTVPAIFLFTIAIGFLDGWSSPARSAMIPRLVEKKQLLKANSFLTMVDRTTELGGWPLGAILVVAIGAANLMWLTVLLYLFATFATTRIENKQTKREMFTESRRFFLSRSLAGWRFILIKPYLRAISVADVLENSANVVWIAAILYVYVDEVLGTGEEWWGYINASFFGGLLIGGMLGYRYASFMEKQISRLIHIGTFAVFLTTLAFSLISTPWVALLFSTLFGFSSQLKGVALQTIVQTNVPEKELARVYSAQEAAGFASFGLSTILFGFLTDLLGARFIFALAAAILLISALYLFVVRKELYLHQVVQTEEPIEKREST
ncbi:hypothetical protein CHH76_06030 [Shouchella clausii]|uniref:MFS transporter n=1 Tax=Shouchella clausii TaxID=79880 RepID=UPI000BA537F0|nr:MFS transporter [Shouchella clausii]PAD10063.1 hypothetical protein CHH76_06030 [Shouchella clausii]